VDAVLKIKLPSWSRSIEATDSITSYSSPKAEKPRACGSSTLSQRVWMNDSPQLQLMFQLNL